MERLKAILADKILDISSASGDEVKAKIDKMQRFRDFAYACQTLMKKYPAIEDELIKMVENGDFDTKVASSRVDTVIRLTDTEAAQAGRIIIPQITEPATAEGSYTEAPIAGENEVSDLPENKEAEPQYTSVDDIPMEIVLPEEEQGHQPEDIDYEELQSSPEEDAENYVPFENVNPGEESGEAGISLEAEENYESELYPDSETEPDTITEAIIKSEQKEVKPEIYGEEIEDGPSEEERAARRKVIIKRIIQVAGLVAIVVALIFIVKFVMLHWQTILIIIGVLAALAILFFWFKRKR
ncbi:MULTISPECIES: hypothetical protein [unclassified Dysgonomonas]|jgi:hypothetical protein|uniref:hypothetical protein n=1 Tax=unclassified Dysgonomonas TaxID=2630389 RepID=UPI0025BBB6B4|nr:MULTISPECIES: hypothetical protein [unclassified Dysgonomonas]MDR2004999.1 hypothetical protein [Prevotella sp.]HMM01287.1 hypothetical protein [Dysgonomonas sp.]